MERPEERATDRVQGRVIDRYPASVSSGFLSSCEETSSGKSDYCACTFKKLQETMSFSEFSAAEKRASDQGVVDPRLLKITSACK